MAIRFLVPDRICCNPRKRIACAYWVGQGRFISPVQGRIEDGVFTIDQVPRCGQHLYIPWTIDGIGEVFVRSSQVMQRDEPYRLTTELARGELTQARDLLASCQSAGVPIANRIEEELKAACCSLLQSVRMENAEQADQLSLQVLKRAVQICNELTIASCRQSTKVCPIGVGLGNSGGQDLPVDLFDHFSIPISWKHLEPEQGQYKWTQLDRLISECRRNKRAFTVGPLVGLYPECLPDWLQAWADDADLVATLMSNFIETVMHRYRTKVRSWEITGGVNADNLLDLGEEKTRSILEQLLRVAHELDPNAELVLTVDQPWGDFLVEGDRCYTPYCMMDCLMRSAAPIRALNIEVAMGFPSCRGNRTLLDFSRMLDRYSKLEIPLRVRLFFPSEAQWQCMGAPGTGSNITEKHQADWLHQHIVVAQSKTAVEQVTWGRLQDDPADIRFPHSGLIAADGRLKPAFEHLRSLVDPTRPEKLQQVAR